MSYFQTIVRGISTISIAINGSLLAASGSTWLLKQLEQAKLINPLIGLLGLAVLLLVGFGQWWWWIQEYGSESPNRWEQGYRYIVLVFGAMAFVLGAVHHVS